MRGTKSRRHGREKWEKLYQKTPGKIPCSIYTPCVSVSDMDWFNLRLFTDCIIPMTDCLNYTLKFHQINILLFLWDTFWSCPSLHGFWPSVFQSLSAIPCQTLQPDPLIAIFGIAKNEPNLSRFHEKCNCLGIVACSTSDTAKLELEWVMYLFSFQCLKKNTLLI